MSTGVAYKLAQRRVDAMEQALDQLTAEPAGEEFTDDLEELVAELADFENPLRRVAAPLRRGQQSATSPHELATAQAAAYLSNRVLALFTKVRTLIQEAGRRNRRVKGLDRLEKAEAAITSARDELTSRWPMPDEARVKAAKEQAAAGKYRVL
jgi:hypothetical protein